MIEIDGLFFNKLFEEYDFLEHLDAIKYKTDQLAKDLAYAFGSNIADAKDIIHKALTAGYSPPNLSGIDFPKVSVWKRIKYKIVTTLNRGR